MLRTLSRALVFSAILTCWPSSADALSPQVEGEITAIRSALPMMKEFRAGDLARFVAGANTTLSTWEQYAARKGRAPDDQAEVDKTTVELLYTYGHMHLEMGNWAAAEPLIMRAIALASKLTSSAEAEACFAFTIAGKLRRLQGNYPEALQYLEKAYAMRKLHVIYYWGSMVLISELAEVLKIKGDFDSARKLWRDLEKSSIGDTAAAELASVNLLAGDYSKFETLVSPAMSFLSNRETEDSAILGVFGHVADYYLTLGSPELAEEPAKELLRRREKLPLPSQVDIADANIRLARVHVALGNAERAAKYIERAEKILNAATPESHPARIPLRVAQAEVFIRKNDLSSAMNTLKLAHTHAEKALGAENYATAKILARLGAVQLAANDEQSAYTSCARASETLEKTLGAMHPDTCGALDNLARAELARKQPGAALPILRKAMDGRDRHAARIFGFVSEAQKVRTMEKLRPETELAVRLALAMPDNDEAVKLGLTAILRRKGRVLDGMAMSRAALRDANSPDEKLLMDQIIGLQRQIVTLIIRGPQGRSAEEHRTMIRELDASKQKLEAQESRMSQRRLLQENPVTVEEVAAALPKDSALVEYAAMPTSDKGNEIRYIAWVVFSDATVRLVDLGPVAPINQLVLSARKAFADVKADPKEPARLLDESILRPVRRVLGKTQWLFISPDGDLNLVPFGALRDESQHWLLDTHSFTYLTSGRDLLVGEAIDEPETEGEPAVFFGSPEFGEKKLGRRRFTQRDNEAPAQGARAIDLSTIKFTPLTGTTAEVTSIEKKIPGAKIHLGDKATEAEVKAVKHPRILHLATHGFFLPDKPKAKNEEEDPLATHTDNPLVRAGVALAGANLLRSGEEDGILTAFEAASLDLYGTKLVVLSACETGVGEARSGEGVYGMRRALTMAGAETTVMSLWQVDDAGTRDLMIGYYDRLLAGGGRAESLRQAALALKTRPNYEHPYYWASFIVSGDSTALSGKLAAPGPGPVAPKARGCACEMPAAADSDSPISSSLAALGFLLAWRMRRRRPEG